MPDGDMIERRPGEEPRPPQQFDVPNIVERPPTGSSYFTEARSLLTANSLLKKVVETQLLPPERFQETVVGEVVDIKKTGETLSVLRKVEGHYEATIFDGQGRGHRILLDPSVKLIGENAIDYVHGTEVSAGERSSSYVLRKLGYSKEDAKKLEAYWLSQAKAWVRLDFDGDATKNDMIQKGEELFLRASPWDCEVMSRPDGTEAFVYTTGKSRFVISPKPPYSKSPLSESDYGYFKDVNVTLPHNLELGREASIFNIKTRDGKNVGTYSGTDPEIDPSNPNILYFINTGRIYSLDVSEGADKKPTPVPQSQIQVADPRELSLDPFGNFLVIRTGNNSLQILDKQTGDVARTYENVRGPILVDKQGDIVHVATEGRIRQIQTNFQAIPAGGTEAAHQRRDEELRQMQERFANLELGKVQKQTGDQISEQDVANTLRETISRQVTEKITTATKGEEIEDVLDRLQGLKADPANQAYTEVVDEFITQAREKLSGIQTTSFDWQLSEYRKALDEVKSVGDTVGLDEQFAKLLELRQKIDITDPQKRREIEQQMRVLQGRKDGIMTQYQGELIEAARQTLPQVEELIKECGSPQELAYFSTGSQAQQLEMMLANIRDPQVRKELRERYNLARSEQRTKLEARGQELAEQDRMRWAQVVDEAREDLSNLQEQITQLSDAREIDRFGRHPLVTAWRAKLFALPPEFREIEEKKLDIILGARKKDMEHRRELGAVGEAGELKFGNATFPVYKEPPRIWQPKLVPRKDGFSEWADLVFEDTQGRVWRPRGEQDVVVNSDMSDERTQRMVERYRKEADEHFRGIKRKVPEFDEHWRITDYHMAKLEEVAEALNLQLSNHRGILILQGEAGTGKNVLGDMLANLSNREMITVQCNENTVKEDLAYEFDFDPKTGTVRYPSRLIEGLQTPGTIIFFDEINALKPGIAKMMNSLFDYRRKLSFTAGGIPKEIVADPTVVFMGAMNPQNYAGVNRLSAEVKSRARVIDFEYPPFEERRGGRTFYRSDEAEMLAAYMDNTAELKQTEFRQVWNYVINRDTTNGADILLQGNPQMEQDVRRIYDVIRVANRLRDMYAAFQIGDSNEPMDFPTSLREVTDIVMEMNHRQGVKPIVKRVVVPKIDDRRQKRLVEQSIDAVLPDNPPPRNP